MNLMGNLLISIIPLINIYAFTIIVGFFIIIIAVVLMRYTGQSEAKSKKNVVMKSLGEALKESRMQCNMTQEFVAERLGVSRQAVSKWESGVSDPSTSNLLQLTKLYDISAEDLLKSIK